MTRRLVLVSLAAGALTVPAPASSAATSLPPASGLAAAARAAAAPTIREIVVRPASPVVGPGDSVRMVIDVVAKDVKYKNGVTVKVEPGKPPADAAGATDPSTGAAPAPAPVAPAPRPALPVPGVQPPAVPPAVAPAVAADDRGVPVVPVGRAVRPQGRPLIPARDHQPALAAHSHDHSASVHPGSASVPPGAARLAAPQRDHKRRTDPRDSEKGRGKHAQSVSWQPTPSWMSFNGDWQTWRFLPDKGLTRNYPAGTWTITATAVGAGGATTTKYTTFQLRRETKLDGVRVTPSPDGSAVRFAGSLNRLGPKGVADYAPFAEQPVDILWRPDGSSAWEEVAEVTTDEGGAFAKDVTGRTGGSWRVRYEGTPRYAPILSRIHQLAN
ncbi:hypothetical protein GCM10010149_09390 [Nonomuraea roseoviolacea subsp. roseoviolacea]|uniref:Uncharacterized protein n=1 Tax=Nonomuraea roseoviolacea subsp. carminata TaxID=160689 RepID=A0ABT1KA84_9ACTN|nr:hypothetical protein [Nonomuraea roseoviolacea]MCP2350876.1 hypothetical protein [Nonomuraea roseoviolacea subsp. carminata]